MGIVAQTVVQTWHRSLPKSGLGLVSSLWPWASELTQKAAPGPGPASDWTFPSSCPAQSPPVEGLTGNSKPILFSGIDGYWASTQGEREKRVLVTFVAQ